MSKIKHEMVAFKADASLLAALKGVPNRSEFIRSAVLAALDSTCPMCGGTGTLTLDQRAHWRAFSADHSLEQCDECEEFHLVCVKAPAADEHDSEAAR